MEISTGQDSIAITMILYVSSWLHICATSAGIITMQKPVYIHSSILKDADAAIGT